MKFDTIREAAHEWVSQFNAIPCGIVEKLLRADCDSIYEVTPPSKYDRVYIYRGKYSDQHAEIIKKVDDEEDLYIVQIDNGAEPVTVRSDDFEVERDGILPMWGMMWAFGEQLDNDWLDGEFCESGLQAMADCGFRIYEQEDYGYIFGIDGAGYDFYAEHWIPLYKARGLHWHKEAA